MWFSAVYKAIQEIPYGKVTSYGHIAALLGYRKYDGTFAHCLMLMSTAERPRYSNSTWMLIITLTRCRQVGVCLKHLPDASDQPDARYNGDTVPWQRVINSKGAISPR